MLSLQYNITKEDYINYYSYVTWDAPENRKKRMIHYGRQLLPIIFFLFAFYYTGLFERNRFFILLIAGFLILTSVLSLLGIRSIIVKQATKIADNPANSSLFLTASLVISETGILLKDDLKEEKYQWRAFIKKQESGQCYFLFINAIQALIIPKRLFSSAEEKQLFEKLLQQHLSFDAELGHLLKS